MELRTLQYFLAIAREQSISGAAAALHITQPTLSRQMIELEESLGMPLFVRGSRRIALTEAGILLRRRAEEILSLVAKTTEELKIPEETLEGDIFIGSGETEGMRGIAKAAKTLMDKHPNIRFHLYSGNADEVTDRLDKGLLDFGLLIDPADVTKYEFLPLPSLDIWGVLMRKDHPLAAYEAISPDMLRDRPLIFSNQSHVSSELTRWYGGDFSPVQVAATYNLVFNASLLVEEGIAIAFCLDRLVNTSEESPLCFRPLTPRLEARMNVVWKKQQVFSRPASAFLEQMRGEFSPAGEPAVVAGRTDD